MTISTNKKKLLAIMTSALLASSISNAVEISKDQNALSFQSVTQTGEVSNFQLTIITPDNKRHTFDVAGNDINILPEQLNLNDFADGMYKYEFIANNPSQSLGQEVRELNNANVTEDFVNTFATSTEAMAGVFTLLDAKLVDADETEVVTRDNVILDDLIVDGSACIGFDCVNGEVFGFDTIRLKENNLRIKFDDTSAGGSFPANDWQLTANDSANGGANKFSIDDVTGGRTPFTVEAGAPNHSLYVDDGGRVGLGTSTPSTEIHAIDGDTPTLRLQQDGSSGFGPQTWDVAGNETNFFVRDVTNGSTLPFRIRPGAPTSSIHIDVDGKIGVGTASPDDSLDIEGEDPTVRLTNTGSGGGLWRIFAKGGSGRLNITDDAAGSRVPLKFGLLANNNLLRVGATAVDNVDIDGNLVVDGNITATGTITPDYVFKSDYPLKSIEEHAEFMWENSHLPHVEKAKMNEAGQGIFSLNQRSQELLEELEIAHIYIEQLHRSQKAMKADFEARLIQLEKK